MKGSEREWERAWPIVLFPLEVSFGDAVEGAVLRWVSRVSLPAGQSVDVRAPYRSGTACPLNKVDEASISSSSCRRAYTMPPLLVPLLKSQFYTQPLSSRSRSSGCWPVTYHEAGPCASASHFLHLALESPA